MTAVAAPVGTRAEGVVRTLGLGPLALESGQVLPAASLAYETWGERAPDASNAVLVLHALTGDTHAAAGRVGPEAPEQTRLAASRPGWWEGLIGPGRAIDTDRYFVVCPNMLGGCDGSTGPCSPGPDGRIWGSRFPRASLRDAVAAEALLADALGIDRWHLVVGGSLGGCRAAEWAVSSHERVRACAVVAAGPAATAEQIAWGHAQALAIRQDPEFRDGDYPLGAGPVRGLELARRIAHITYRSPAELDRRFGRRGQEGTEEDRAVHGRGRYRVESYLDHQGRQLARRFDANAYLGLTEALLGHDLGRGRGGLRTGLARSTCRWTVAAVDSDRLFHPEQSELLAASLPRPVRVRRIASARGHDGFLTETQQLGRILTETVL
ncbi:homoserine O-acetyltransferase MetX [Rothia kristinae]|uniref:homoserine O-acetyltransferase MetX n=2 Tax=Rothia kristinae TaxID=37923 RepID=UPI0035CCD15B